MYHILAAEGQDQFRRIQHIEHRDFEPVRRCRAEQLAQAPVQHLGKLLLIYKPATKPRLALP